jgi:hypothetical protein
MSVTFTNSSTLSSWLALISTLNYKTMAGEKYRMFKQFIHNELGITKDDIPAILQTGITGIALSGTVLRADDPIAEMKHIINIINHE